MLEITTSRDVQIVIFKGEDGFYIAQCLQIDVNAPGADPSGALDSLCRGLVLKIAISVIMPNGELELPSPAPVRYWEMFGAAQLEAPEKISLAGVVQEDGRTVTLECTATVRLLTDVAPSPN